MDFTTTFNKTEVIPKSHLKKAEMRIIKIILFPLCNQHVTIFFLVNNVAIQRGCILQIIVHKKFSESKQAYSFNNFPELLCALPAAAVLAGEAGMPSGSFLFIYEHTARLQGALRERVNE